MKFLLDTDFKVEENPLDFLNHFEKLIMQEDGQEAMEYPADMLAQVGAAFVSNVDYGSSVTSLGPCSADGKTGEKYRVQSSFDVKVLFVRSKGTTDSELCMSGSVPFGRLWEKTVTTSDKGKPTNTIEMRVLDSGSGATSAIKGPVKAVEMPKMPW